jgi:phosphatidylinositol glycan class A protein
MIVLAEPDPSDMVRATGKAISLLPNIDPQQMHNRVSEPFMITLVFLRIS